MEVIDLTYTYVGLGGLTNMYPRLNLRIYDFNQLIKETQHRLDLILETTLVPYQVIELGKRRLTPGEYPTRTEVGPLHYLNHDTDTLFLVSEENILYHITYGAYKCSWMPCFDLFPDINFYPYTDPLPTGLSELNDWVRSLKRRNVTSGEAIVVTNIKSTNPIHNHRPIRECRRQIDYTCSTKNPTPEGVPLSPINPWTLKQVKPGDRRVGPFTYIWLDLRVLVVLKEYQDWVMLAPSLLYEGTFGMFALRDFQTDEELGVDRGWLCFRFLRHYDTKPDALLAFIHETEDEGNIRKEGRKRIAKRNIRKGEELLF